MNVHFGFSIIGAVFLIMLFIPNLFWTQNKPKNYDKYASDENKILLIFERVGEVLVTCFALVFADPEIGKLTPRLFLLALAIAVMILYEIYWIRYFRSEHKMSDFYSSILGIPLAGAVLPVIAFLLLGIYKEENIFLIIADIILGIGHIGIHAGHLRDR